MSRKKTPNITRRKVLLNDHAQHGPSPKRPTENKYNSNFNIWSCSTECTHISLSRTFYCMDFSKKNNRMNSITKTWTLLRQANLPRAEGNEAIFNSRNNTLSVSASVRTVSCFSLRTCSGTSCGRQAALPITVTEITWIMPCRNTTQMWGLKVWNCFETLVKWHHENIPQQVSFPQFNTT